MYVIKVKVFWFVSHFRLQRYLCSVFGMCNCKHGLPMIVSSNKKWVHFVFVYSQTRTNNNNVPTKKTFCFCCEWLHTTCVTIYYLVCAAENSDYGKNFAIKQENLIAILCLLMKCIHTQYLCTPSLQAFRPTTPVKINCKEN